jgi:hypothetical protein
MTYAHHPIANIFPLLQTGELAELSDDIKQNGLKQPIYLYEGKILDGRNRFAACQSAGVEPKFEQYTGDSPTSFVISLNLKRRHLTTSQAAAVAVDALPFFESEARKRQEAGNNQHRVTQKVAEGSKGEAREKVAAVLHTNRQYVSDAKAIKAKAPERFEQIRTGEKTIREVKREMRREDQEVKIKAAQDAPKPKVVKGPFDVILADPPWRYEHCEADNREIENQSPLGRCYLLPVLQLQRAWSVNSDKWKQDFPFKIKARNPGYTTVSYGIPVSVLFPAIGDCLRVKFTPMELAE